MSARMSLKKTRGETRWGFRMIYMRQSDVWLVTDVGMTIKQKFGRCWDGQGQEEVQPDPLAEHLPAQEEQSPGRQPSSLQQLQASSRNRHRLFTCSKEPLDGKVMPTCQTLSTLRRAVGGVEVGFISADEVWCLPLPVVVWERGAAERLRVQSALVSCCQIRSYAASACGEGCWQRVVEGWALLSLLTD